MAPGFLLLGGSWVVISGVIRPLVWVITILTLLITPLIATHEPPSRVLYCRGVPLRSFRGLGGIGCGSFRVQGQGLVLQGLRVYEV